MTPTQAAIKNELRVRVRGRLAALNEGKWQAAERAIHARVIALAEQLSPIQQTKSREEVAWMGFLPIAREPRDEVDLSNVLLDLMRQPRHRVCLPRVNWASKSLTPVPVQNLSTDIVVGRYSLREPKADLLPLAPGDLDVVIVPGLAFDSTGARLGRGGGLYDRLLARVAGLPAGNRPVSVGVCVDEQVVEKVPVEAHDLRVDMILTPTTILRGA